MGKCINHPDRETNYLCMKHNIYLCEECLKCTDPDIHCKFRSSCPIWFIDKRGGKKIDEDSGNKDKVKVIFESENKTALIEKGKTLLEAAHAADVPLNASCNGKGVCGKCKLVLVSGEAKAEPTSLLSDKEKEKNYVLACQTTVEGDLTVKIPEEVKEKKMQIAGVGKQVTERLKGLVKEINPMLVNIPLRLEVPTLEDSISDLDRLNRGLDKSGFDTSKMNIGMKVMRELANIMRDENWNVTASVIKKKCSSEVVSIIPGNIPRNIKDKSLGIAIDLGTTSIVVYLVDMENGDILAATSGHNRQAACGDDVINRIVCAEKDGVKKLSAMVLSTINGLINEAILSAEVDRTQIENAVVSGNTTMTHLLLGIEAKYIRREPYIPSVSAFPIIKASDIGFKINPDAAIFIMPGPASYVGGDIVSGLLYTGLHREEPLTLFIDIGTNGEIVLGNKEWLMTASCSAGPAFEGGGVRWGMRAEDGAIEKISIDPETLDTTVSVVGNVPPRGICGSGMIDLISEMLLKGIIQSNGKISIDSTHPRYAQIDDEKAYIVAFADETTVEQNIIFTETDIDNILRSKGAVYAGFIVLLNQAGLDFSMVDQVIITGGFGQYLNIDKAVNIGLLPDIERSKFKYMGNSSIAGAYMALLSEKYRNEALTISNTMTYIDFSSNNEFMDEFTSALFLPHTNIKQFPSVEKALNHKV